MADANECGSAVPPTDVPSLVAAWLGPSRWRSTGPLPAGRLVAVVNSRLPRLMDPRAVWFQAMRAALDRLREPNTIALIAAGTAGSEFVLRGTERQSTPRVVVWGSSQSNGARTTHPCPPHQLPDVSVLHTDVWRASKTISETSINLDGVPDRDRIAITWPDEIIVLSLRAGGNLHTLLRERLRHSNACVLLANNPKLQSPRARDELLTLGAKTWDFFNATPVNESLSRADCKAELHARSSIVVPDIIRCPPVESWDYLTHSTRACPGPWPGQSNGDYIDSLLDCGPDSDHSALGSLIRIVEERRLVASARAIRGGFKVVSFTEVPLVELPRLRVFRVHRARWDFEPYGICIRRQRLVEFGARPVVYGDDSSWKGLSGDDRPFFQQVCPRNRCATRSRRSAGIDWSVEREWRHVGDVDLSRLSRDDAVLFVPTVAGARKLLEISPWPVTVLESPST